MNNEIMDFSMNTLTICQLCKKSKITTKAILTDPKNPVYICADCIEAIRKPRPVGRPTKEKKEVTIRLTVREAVLISLMRNDEIDPEDVARAVDEYLYTIQKVSWLVAFKEDGEES